MSSSFLLGTLSSQSQTYSSSPPLFPSFTYNLYILTKLSTLSYGAHHRRRITDQALSYSLWYPNRLIYELISLRCILKELVAPSVLLSTCPCGGQA